MTLAHNDIVDKSRDTFRGAFEKQTILKMR